MCRNRGVYSKFEYKCFQRYVDFFTKPSISIAEKEFGKTKISSEYLASSNLNHNPKTLKEIYAFVNGVELFESLPRVIGSDKGGAGIRES